MSERSWFLSQMLTGCVLQQPDLLTELLQSLDPNDLDGPYAVTVAALSRMSTTGTVDPWQLQQTVAAASPGLHDQFIAHAAQAGVPAVFGAYLAEFREGLARRRLGDAGQVIGQAARMEDLRLGIEKVKEVIADAESTLTPQAVPLLDGDLLWNYEAPAESVLIPGLLWRQSRALITGFEGGGKSILLRQLAIAGALGVHPFKTHGRIDPIRTLVLDLENPPAIAQTAMRSMLDTLRDRRVVGPGVGFEGRFQYQIRSEGVDIIGRGRDREWVTRAVATHRPDLLCIGPVYRLAAAGGNLDEATAGGLLDYLNNLRSTYDVAIITEAHASKGANDEKDPNLRRGLTPSGSAVWMRFPEIGRGLRHDPKASESINRSVYRLEEWRGDRSLHMRFPDWVARGMHGQIWFDDVTEEVVARRSV